MCFFNLFSLPPPSPPPHHSPTLPTNTHAHSTFPHPQNHDQRFQAIGWNTMTIDGNNYYCDYF